MARYAVEHIWEGKQEYFLIRDHQSWQMVLLPSKYLTHLIRANRSPNTVGRRAKSIRFYLEYLDEKEMELSQVAELEFQEQYEHYVGFLHWLKAEEQTMKKKQVLAVSSALMIGTTTALTGLPTPVMAQENTEVVQEAVVEENKTEQVPVEQKTENAEVQENITDKEQEETAENAETLKEESTKQETPATPEKEVVTEDKTVEASKNTEVKAGSIAIDETHFPDKVFREQIIAEFDKDGDSVLSVDEISKAQFLNLHGMKTISSLEGIQYLTNLQSLDVTVTSVSDLSPVKSSFLKRLDCSSSKVRSVDLTRYPNLETFVCENTSINSLDVSKNEKLNTLFADSTSISKLDVTNNPNLEQLTCGNTGLTELDVTHNPQLATLHIGDTKVNTLDISKNPNLKQLSYYMTNIAELDVTKNTKLTRLFCQDTYIKKLDLSITLPTKSKITVTKDGETINDDTKVYTGTFTQSLELSENCTFEISIETYSDNSITIDGKEISFDKTDWQEGQPAIITLQVGKGNQKETEEYSQYDDSDYDYGYSDEYYGQEGDYTYDQNEYTEQTNDY